MKQPIGNKESHTANDSTFFQDIAEVIHAARRNLVKQVNTAMVVTYFEIGRKIIENEHYIALCRIDNSAERQFYELEIAANGWSFREFQRQFDSALYERLALSRNKKKVREMDLKLGKLKHHDIGQMQMYVNFYDRTIKLSDENPTIGIILCKEELRRALEEGDRPPQRKPQ